MQTRTLRLAVLSYLVFVLYLWVARLLGLTGVVLPLSSTATGSQADSMTAVLLLMGFVGIVGAENCAQKDQDARRPSTQSREHLVFRCKVELATCLSTDLGRNGNFQD
jgi:hypothetical protein